MPRVAKSLHLACTPADRLVAVSSAVIDPRGGLHEDTLHTAQLRDVRLGCRVPDVPRRHQRHARAIATVRVRGQHRSSAPSRSSRRSPACSCFRTPVGVRVEPGQEIADVVDPLTDRVVTITNSIAGVLYVRHRARFTTAGLEVARIAGAKPIRSGSLLPN